MRRISHRWSPLGWCIQWINRVESSELFDSLGICESSLAAACSKRGVGVSMVCPLSSSLLTLSSSLLINLVVISMKSSLLFCVK
jgi:hypothetical protein